MKGDTILHKDDIAFFDDEDDFEFTIEEMLDNMLR